MLARASLETGLRSALESGEICIHLQPVVNAGLRLVGAEALARWNHPERGIVPPAEFIPLAEQTGLIRVLGRQVLQAACAQLVAWSHAAATAQVGRIVPHSSIAASTCFLLHPVDPRGFPGDVARR